MGLFDTLRDSLGSLSGQISPQYQNQTQTPQNQGNPLSNNAGLIGATAVGGLLGALLGGSKGMQRAARNVAAVGAGAAVAGLAYSFLKKWRDNASNAPAPDSAQSYQPAQPWQQQRAPDPYTAAAETYAAQNASGALTPYEDQGALLLLQAMIYAARADGFMDKEEKTLIENCAAQLGGNSTLALQRFASGPIDPVGLARQVRTMDEACDIYRISAAAIRCDDIMEQGYLNALAQALSLNPSQKAQLDNEANEFRTALERR
ncbi:MAG TPA: DUF533 domain-containing protein [Candidatus Avisuccinivibrio pullicola]|nr:DUF533 domain-containing protein [Candidatus Avisuccinivibrio pullicola]